MTNKKKVTEKPVTNNLKVPEITSTQKRESVSRTRTINNTGTGMVDTLTYRNTDTGKLEQERRTVDGPVGPSFNYITKEAANDHKFNNKYETWQDLQKERPPHEEPDIRGELQRQYDEVAWERTGRKSFTVPELPWKKDT